MKALQDCGLDYSSLEQAVVGYCYGKLYCLRRGACIVMRYCTSVESNHVLVQLVTRKVEGCCHLQSHIKIDCVIKMLPFVINVVINHCVAKVVSTAYCVNMT